ncbi:MAG: hypothetical protein ABFS42_14855 [Candidatus Krumholzibacteriota bacterium]
MNDDRLRDLSETIEQLQESVRSLEWRVGALERAESVPAVSAPAESPQDYSAETPVEEFGFTRPSATRVFFLLGQAIVILGGAFLLRALTDAGTLPPMVGFVVGLVYALALIFLSDRASGKGDEGGATVIGITAAAVAFPFLFETTKVLNLLSPTAGGLVLVIISVVALGSAWRRSVRVLSWVYSMAIMGTILALGFATGAAEFYAALLLVLGLVTMLMAYAKKWHFKRWVTAFAANLVIYRLTVLATNPPTVGSGKQTLSLPVVQALAIALVVLYLGMFTYRALVRGRGVKAFDVVQSALVLVIGFLGAIRIGSLGGIGAGVLGWTALAAAAGYYTVAFTVVRQRHGRGRGFFYFASLALVFLFLGSRALAEGPWLAWCWIALGLVTAVLGGRFDRVTLRAHSAVYLILASFQTGLVGAALDSYFGSPESVWRGVDISGFVALLVMTGCYWILALTSRSVEMSPYRRLPRFFVAVLCLVGFTSLAIVLVVKMVAGTPPDAVASSVAVVRTGVLALAALGLAVAGRRKDLVELGWLVYPLLAFGLVKLLWEDLRAGNPMALAISFALFGAALILAPRILRVGKKKERGDEG